MLEDEEDDEEAKVNLCSTCADIVQTLNLLQWLLNLN